MQADTPNGLIEGGLPTEGTLAHVAIPQYADHLPLHHQCRIYGRGGADLMRWLCPIDFPLVWFSG